MSNRDIVAETDLIIDEGEPDETISDYSPAEGGFNDWWEGEQKRRAAA